MSCSPTGFAASHHRHRRPPKIEKVELADLRPFGLSSTRPFLAALQHRLGDDARRWHNHNTNSTMIGRTALVRTANRAVARRTQSTGSTPKMHRAKDAWSELEATRAPKDHDDLHVSVAQRTADGIEYVNNTAISVF